MNARLIDVLQHHLRTAEDNLERRNTWINCINREAEFTSIQHNIREALILLENWDAGPKAGTEVGIRVNIDTGDTVEQLNRCHKAIQELIKSKKELDLLFYGVSGGYGLQYPHQN
jgi:hypothetical protein